MNRAERYIRRQAKSGDHEALAIVALWDDHKPIKKGKVAPGRSRKERKATLAGRWAQVRAAVVLRAGERTVGTFAACELCRETSWEELHHLDSGPNRRAHEAPENVVACCMRCHRAYHAGDFDVMRSALYWARDHGYSDTAQIVQRRIEHATRAQRSSGTR